MPGRISASTLALPGSMRCYAGSRCHVHRPCVLLVRVVVALDLQDDGQYEHPGQQSYLISSTSRFGRTSAPLVRSHSMRSESNPQQFTNACQWPPEMSLTWTTPSPLAGRSKKTRTEVTACLKQA